MKKKILISLNILIVLLEIVATYLSACEFNLRMFTYYTQYSNLFALISSILLIIYLFKDEVPNWLKFFRYITVNMMTITFFVVTFILVPLLVYAIGVKGFLMFTKGSMLYHHLVCPIILFISYVFYEKWNPITKKDKIYVLAPTLTYGIIFVLLNAINVIDGPYPFLMVDELPIYLSIISFIGIYTLTCFVGLTIYKLALKA